MADIQNKEYLSQKMKACKDKKIKNKQSGINMNKEDSSYYLKIFELARDCRAYSYCQKAYHHVNRYVTKRKMLLM